MTSLVDTVSHMLKQQTRMVTLTGYCSGGNGYVYKCLHNFLMPLLYVSQKIVTLCNQMIHLSLTKWHRHE